MEIISFDDHSSTSRRCAISASKRTKIGRRRAQLKCEFPIRRCGCRREPGALQTEFPHRGVDALAPTSRMSMLVAVLSLMSIIFSSSSRNRIRRTDAGVAEFARTPIFIAATQHDAVRKIEPAGLQLTKHLDHDGNLDRRGGRHARARVDAGVIPGAQVEDFQSARRRKAGRKSARVVIQLR